MNITWIEKGDRSTLASTIADDVTNIIKRSIKEHDRASIALPGGSTPIPFLKCLNSKDIQWEKLSVTLTDERCVNTDDPNNNEAMIKEHLPNCQNGPFKSLNLNDLEPHESLQIATKNIMSIQRPFDVTILGMGADAHIASLFPHNEASMIGLDYDNDDLCIIVHPENVSPNVTRISQTLSSLLNSKQIYLYINGMNKKDAYEKALESHNAVEYPVSAVLHQNYCPVTVYWSS